MFLCFWTKLLFVPPRHHGPPGGGFLPRMQQRANGKALPSKIIPLKRDAQRPSAVFLSDFLSVALSQWAEGHRQEVTDYTSITSDPWSLPCRGLLSAADESTLCVCVCVYLGVWHHPKHLAAWQISHTHSTFVVACAEMSRCWYVTDV